MIRFLLGFILGANVGIILFALFQGNKEEE